ncbi:MAG: GNAT family N-acetyltransferase [Candidatus Bipolaricaulota bacterium]|nr:MAG: GNAT family N-acetyltransferase [Candidatus Bipolaricaulota bacterium]
MQGDVVAVWGAWDEERQARYVAQILCEGDVRIVRVEGRDAGSLTVRRCGPSLHIESIVLLPEVQGRGVGSRLIAGVCGVADDLGLSVSLSVLRVSRAIVFYERLGFSVVDESDTHLEMERAAGTTSPKDPDLAA